MDSQVEETEWRTRGRLRQPAAAGQRTREEGAAEKARYLERACLVLMKVLTAESVSSLGKHHLKALEGTAVSVHTGAVFPSPELENL